MAVRYRAATRHDLLPATEAVAEALNDLERRHGFDGVTGPLDTSFAEFCLADDASGLWVAEDESEILGFGFSWYADELWYLAQLFVRPRCQQSGIGRTMLERTLEQAGARQSSCLALITFAYNRVSLGLYMRHGMFPRVPLYEVAGRLQQAIALPPRETLSHEEVSGDEKRVAELDRFDRQVLGVSRAKHHRFSLRSSSLRALLFRGGNGAPVGYAYVSANGAVGPIAVSEPAHMSAALATAFLVAANAGCERVSALLPGCCDAALAAALGGGLRLGRTMVFLSSRPFADWTRYAPRGPGYM